MPTNLEYALFAANVYGNTIRVRSEQNTLPIPTGWEPIGTPVVLADGFMARAYKKGSEIVISHAGTTDENMLDWITGNGPGGTAAFPAPQITDAAQFYLDIAKANPRVTDFKFTGHSLGGGLASLMAVYFDKPAVVFDEAPFQKSADSAGVVNALKTKLIASGYTLPLSFASYAALDPTGSFFPSPSRVERDDQVKQIYVKGEVLSLASTAMLNFTAAALGLIDPKLWVIGTGVDKVRGSEIVIDPKAKTILDWGTTAWGHTVTSGDQPDTRALAPHSMNLHANRKLRQPCRRTRRASVPARLRARGLGAATTRPSSRQHLGLQTNSVATANWLRRSGTATRHVCGFGWPAGENCQDRQVQSMRLTASKLLTKRMDRALSGGIHPSARSANATHCKAAA